MNVEALDALSSTKLPAAVLEAAVELAEDAAAWTNPNWRRDVVCAIAASSQLAPEQQLRLAATGAVGPTELLSAFSALNLELATCLLEQVTVEDVDSVDSRVAVLLLEVNDDPEGRLPRLIASLSDEVGWYPNFLEALVSGTSNQQARAQLLPALIASVGLEDGVRPGSDIELADFDTAVTIMREDPAAAAMVLNDPATRRGFEDAGFYFGADRAPDDLVPGSSTLDDIARWLGVPGRSVDEIGAFVSGESRADAREFVLRRAFDRSGDLARMLMPNLSAAEADIMLTTCEVPEELRRALSDLASESWPQWRRDQCRSAVPLRRVEPTIPTDAVPSPELAQATELAAARELVRRLLL